ncbi:TetR/AcrR family transcriptional regulator, partial [Klebsiella pneumoniae]
LDRVAKVDAQDNVPTGTLVRYAADGIWLSELTEGRTMSSEHRQSLVNDLTKMTLPA